MNVTDGEMYRKVTKMLLEVKYTWYSYNNKQINPIGDNTNKYKD